MMKNRLQALWNEAVGRGPCPQPEARDVQRRVNAALREQGHRRPARPLRAAVAAALAVAVLASATVLAAGELIPSPFNVLTSSFTGENAANAAALMSIEPVSVSDDNYTLTVTSSLADGNKLYFTLAVEAKSDEAMERLMADGGTNLSFRVAGSNGYGSSGDLDPDNPRLLYMNVSLVWKSASRASVRLDVMREGLWLEFPVKPVRTVEVKVSADGQGMGGMDHPTGGPVSLKSVEVSPLGFTLDYTTPYLEQGTPVVYFLYQDGTVSTQGQLGAVYASGHGEQVGLFGGDERPFHRTGVYKFPSVQDLGRMAAVVFEGTAYPLDGGEPYPVDMSGYIRPFTVPLGEILGDSADSSVPFFALCDSLGVPYTWDEETGTARAVRGGTALTFTRDSAAMGVEAPGTEDCVQELSAASVYRDGELWVDAAWAIRGGWELDMIPAYDRINPVYDAEGMVLWTHWVVVP